jgi:hypothetical protein
LGKLKWSPYDYYTSSPREFYYACLGYFAEREDNIILMRNVARFASVGYVKPFDFDNAWPIGVSAERDYITLDDDFKETILRIHNKSINE